MSLPRSAAILALVATVAPAITFAAAPSAVIPSRDIKLDAVVKGEEIHHQFVIENTGDAELTIDRVASSCGCTVTSFDRSIAAGESGVIDVTIDTTSLSGESVTTIKAFTNDPESPELYLSIHLTVDELLGAHPGQARWNIVQGERQGTISQSIWALDGADFEITSVDNPLPKSLDVTFRPATTVERTPAKGSQWRVEMTLDNFAPVGPVSGELVVHTNHPLQKVIWIPITGFVRPIVAVTPSVGQWGEIDPASPTVLNLLVVNFATEPMALTKVESSLFGVASEVLPLDEGRRYTVRLTMEGEMPQGPFSGTVTIHTDNPQQPKIKVSVQGTIL